MQVLSVYSPQKAFRIPADAMKLDGDAKEAARLITTDLPKAMDFINTFGIFVCNGENGLQGPPFSQLTCMAAESLVPLRNSQIASAWHYMAILLEQF